MISNVLEGAPRMILHAGKIIIYEGLHVQNTQNNK